MTRPSRPLSLALNLLLIGLGSRMKKFVTVMSLRSKTADPGRRAMTDPHIPSPNPPVPSSSTEQIASGEQPWNPAPDRTWVTTAYVECSKPLPSPRNLELRSNE